jgi:hypothetical protein
MYKCECGKDFDRKSRLCKHKEYCDGKNNPDCWVCPKCNNPIVNSRLKHLNSCDGFGTRRSKPKIKGTPEFSRRISEGVKNAFIIHPDMRKNISEGVKKAHIDGKSIGRAKTPELEAERKRKISSHASSEGKYGGYKTNKKGWFKGFWCDSSWELAFVIYHLDNNIPFERNHKCFPYVWRDEIKHYTPDFIKDNIYYEIKGFFDEKSLVKIQTFKEELKVLNKSDMKLYLDYATSIYGKDFIKLYETK